MDGDRWADEILPVLAPRLADRIARATRGRTVSVEEIRLREGRPLHLVFSDGDRFVTDTAQLCHEPEQGLNLSREDLHRSFQMMAQGSVYAWEDEVRSGFLTLRGGHRVGLAGKVVTDSGRIRTLKHVGSGPEIPLGDTLDAAR